MFIYVAGPYGGDTGKPTKEQIDASIRLADDAALQIAQRGHAPLVPHSMMKDWQTKWSRPGVLRVGFQWLQKCDAILYLGPSPGADAELALAMKLGLKVYKNIDEIPAKAEEDSCATLIGAAEILRAEYEDIAESYRHTYQTLWQAGAILIAISGAIAALLPSARGSTPLLALAAPIPFLIWYWGIFQPMDSYGRFRAKLLKEKEAKLNELLHLNDEFKLSHYTRYDEEREKRPYGVHHLFNGLGWLASVYWVPSFFLWLIQHFGIMDLSVAPWVRPLWPWLFRYAFPFR